MSVPNTQQPTYLLSINSPEDIERALNNSDQDKQKISKILDFNYMIHSPEKTSNHLNIGKLFKVAYCGSYGLTTCPKFVNVMDSYQALLAHSFTVCIDITPLLILSFKCHQAALHSYEKTGQQELAMAQMAETGELAKKIASKYNELEKEFRLVNDEVKETIPSLAADSTPLYIKQRQFETKPKTGTALESLEESILKVGILSLETSMSTSFKIHWTLLNIIGFWRDTERYSQGLSSPNLADPDLVELIKSDETQKAEEKFYQILGDAEKILNAVSAPYGRSGDEKGQPMKTGRNAIISIDPPKKSVVELLKSTRTEGIEKEFEKSYLNWLALAKVNQTMITAIKKAMTEVEENRNDILRIGKNPLAILSRSN